MAEPSRLDCQCGAAFAAAWSRDRLGGIVAAAPCPGCGSTGRVFRAAIPGWVPPAAPPAFVAAVEEPAPIEAAPAPRATPDPGPTLTRPKPRPPVQGALGL